MSPDDAEEYTQALGQVFSGGWRQRLLADRLGVPQALGLSLQEWSNQRLGGYIRESIPARREAALELTAPPEEGGEGLSKRKAAEVLGVAESTIRADLNAQNRAPEAEDEEPPQVNEPDVKEPAQNRAPEQPSEAVTEFLDSDEDLQRARYLHEFMKALTRSDDFMEFDPQKLGEIADMDMVRIIDDYVISVRNFAERFHRARPGLQVVNGGKA